MLYFLTHPQVEIDPGVAVTAWPLSREGRRRLEAVRTAAAFDSITQVWASSERKAVETARLLTHGRPIETMICPELGENDRSSTGYLPREQFERHADRFFVYPTESIDGWERAIDAQARIVAAYEQIQAVRRGGDALVCAHGAVGALLLCHLTGAPISRDHDQPANGGGNYCTVAGGQVEGWRPIEQLLSAEGRR